MSAQKFRMKRTNIAELAGLPDSALNDQAAMCLGWTFAETEYSPVHKVWEWRDQKRNKWYEPPSYCASHDAVHRDLLPEVGRRALEWKFLAQLNNLPVDGGPLWMVLLTPCQLVIAFICTIESNGN